MARQVTQFDLLISCPSDVRKELDIIKETVENFNRMFGATNNASLNVKHWSTDSYPESGGHPQHLLNKQFVFDCDAAVAVFWTRFGTPTESYDSGTEEEIEELIKSGKQVFLYFSDCAINPSSVDHDQYQRVLAFRNKYKDNGIYSSYSNIEGFKKDFLNHLSLYFVKLLNGGSTNTTAKSKLSIQGVQSGKAVEQPKINKSYYINSKFMQEKTNAISVIFKDIESIILPPKKSIVETLEPEKQIDNESSFLTLEMKQNMNKISSILKDQKRGFDSLFPSSLVEINVIIKETIERYVQENDINLNDVDEFFNTGELMKKQQFTGGGPYGLSPSYSLVGTDDEQQKYKLIKDLYWQIEEYKQFEEYLSIIDSKCFLELAVLINGTSFDEDIDIKVYIKKGYLCKVDRDIPFPGDDILETINHLFNRIFKPERTVSIAEYDAYAEFNNNIALPLGLLGEHSSEKKLEQDRNEYSHNIETIFCYEFYQDDDYDILCYKQEYLKQNTSIFLPSKLLFNSPPNEIKYEITSKHCAELIQGELKI
ncbi:hypothetical protein L1N85_25420 [Paenibacillus alkaliterrae]|uniref:hypothetical protein n=1 Tax=Paenibacillus alkaliterrae TaxID=320909 RepID=UPI001F1F18CD|nr:hypothetical protein [Paenibacillus alkaliterrae]MCF2941675.1 hypothetical protein [Paenibacillus alkaliterrae]